MLTLPGETAAWYESTLYARVNGYVAKWFVDIGEHVRRGQILATIDTPELDADLTAARAELTAAEAQVKVRAAEAEFAKSTNERWRDSPKGVVSDQEREAKRADYDARSPPRLRRMPATSLSIRHAWTASPLWRSSSRSPLLSTARSQSVASISAIWSPLAAPTATHFYTD